MARILDIFFMSCMIGRCRLCSIARNRLKNGFYWGNLEGKGSKRWRHYPDTPTFPQRGMLKRSGGTLLASCFCLLQLWEQSHQCGNRLLWPKDIKLSLETLRLMTGLLSLFSGVATRAFLGKLSETPSPPPERIGDSRSQPAPCLANWSKLLGSHLDTCSLPLPHFKMLFAGGSLYYFSWSRSVPILYS